MKKLNIIQLFTIIFYTFGISFLNFKDLSFSVNVKAYLALLFGVFLTIISIVEARKTRKHKQ